VIGGLGVDHVSYHWIFWIGAIGPTAAVAAQLLVPESLIRSPGRVRRGAWCSPSVSCCRCGISQAHLGLDLGRRSGSPPGWSCWRVGSRSSGGRSSLCRHRNARQGTGADDECDAPRRLRHVRLVHDPSSEAPTSPGHGLGLDAGRPADAAVAAHAPARPLSDLVAVRNKLPLAAAVRRVGGLLPLGRAWQYRQTVLSAR
jgi:hypothetical protein